MIDNPLIFLLTFGCSVCRSGCRSIAASARYFCRRSCRARLRAGRIANMAQSTMQAGGGRLRKLLLAAAGLQQSSHNVGDVLFHRSIHNHRIKRPSIVHKRSTDILHDPWFNKVGRFLHNWRYLHRSGTRRMLVYRQAARLHVSDPEKQTLHSLLDRPREETLTLLES